MLKSGSPLLRLAVATVIDRPLIYDVVQVLAGSRRCYARLRHLLPTTAEKRVVDVGGGTGRALRVLEPTAHYFCFDVDFRKLSRLRAKHRAAIAVRADARALPARDGHFDIAVCAFVCHHLNDDVLRAALREMARVCSGFTLIMEPLWMPSRPVSRFLWRYDQGSYPRTRSALLQEIDRYFEVDQLEEFAIFHRYILLRCRRKASH